MNDSKSFNIFDHLNQIEIVKETSTDYQCLCPVCGDGGFKIDKRSGKYNTFKCGCMDTEAGKKAVIEAIAPKDNNKKSIRPKQSRHWIYSSRDGQPRVRVCREDFGDGRTPKRSSEHWDGQKWVRGLKGIKREDIPIYRYQEVREALALGQTLFIVEGEPCADALWNLGLPATTNIGGAGKWKPSDSQDLAGAKLVLCPDRDKPGVIHMEKLATDFPHAQWLYAFPNSPFWNNLPDSQGLDVADWIAEEKLTAAEILSSVEPRRSLPQKDKAFQSQGKAAEEISFEQMLERVDEIQQLPCPGERKWLLAKLAKRCKLSVSQMMSAYDSALCNQPAFSGIGIQELLAKTPERFDWLIAGLMPSSTTALLYAEAGTGKTLLTNSLIKAIAGGENWNGYPTKPGKVLYVQTDEPEVNTAHNLKEAGFASIPNANLTLYFKWQFDQTAQLREQIAEEKPVLVVIDSLTSSNRTATVEEKSVEYGRGLYELRDLAMEFGCAILVLHHENKNGGVRGTTAIKANVSEVWHLKRCDKLSANHRLLEIEKSRAGCTGTRQLELDVYDLSWTDQGEYEPSGKGEKRGSNGARLLNFLQSRPGVKFEVDELVGEFGKSRDAVRMALSRLYKSGLIDCESRVKTTAKGNASRYKVYLAPEVFNSSPTLAPSELELSNTLSNPLPVQEGVQETVQQFQTSDSKDLGPVEPNSPQTQPIFSSDSQPTTTSTAQPTDNSEPESNNSQLPTPNSQLPTPNSSLLIDWVRYQGEVWSVASQDQGILKLRQSGFRQVLHTVHVSQVEIGGYKQ
jgi:DNA-binding transcriptional ArsR family regulator